MSLPPFSGNAGRGVRSTKCTTSPGAAGRRRVMGGAEVSTVSLGI